MTLSNSLPNTSELKCEQDHEYSLNKLLFATWKSSGLFPFAQVSELFLLLSPSSSRQSSCEYMQPHLTNPSTIHGRTGMNQYISRMNTVLQRLLKVRFFRLIFLTFVTNKTSIGHSILRGMLSQFCWKHCHASLWRPIFTVSVRGIKKSSYSQRSLFGQNTRIRDFFSTLSSCAHITLWPKVRIRMELEASSHFYFAQVSLFCYSRFRLQLITIHCNWRAVWTDHTHTAYFSCTLHMCFTPLCGSRCRTTCLHKACSSTCHHMSEHLLFSCFVFFLCLSCLHFLSHCYLFSVLNFNLHDVEHAEFQTQRAMWSEPPSMTSWSRLRILAGALKASWLGGATAAADIASRWGVGKIRHLDVGTVSLQNRITEGHVTLKRSWFGHLASGPQATQEACGGTWLVRGAGTGGAARRGRRLKSTKTMASIFKRIVVGQVWMKFEESSFLTLIFVTVGFFYSR